MVGKSASEKAVRMAVSMGAVMAASWEWREVVELACAWDLKLAALMDHV